MTLAARITVCATAVINISFVIFTQCYRFDEQKNQQLWVENWTTCDEFLPNSTFDINSIVDIDWKIFYFWNHDEERSYNIRFSLATPILVDRFKVELINMSSTVDWSKAVLFMETSIDLSALYIATEKSGLFRLVPSLTFQFEYNNDIPKLIFALKTVEAGYLGIMNCKTRYCYALAPADKMPGEKDVKLAAEKLGFRGDYNRSYLFRNARVPVSPSKDGSEEDDTINIENQIDIDD